MFSNEKYRLSFLLKHYEHLRNQQRYKLYEKKVTDIERVIIFENLDFLNPRITELKRKIALLN